MQIYSKFIGGFVIDVNKEAATKVSMIGIFVVHFGQLAYVSLSSHCKSIWDRHSSHRSVLQDT